MLDAAESHESTVSYEKLRHDNGKKFNYSGGTENIDYLKIDGAQRAGYSKKNVVVLSPCVVRPGSFGLCRDI